MNQLCETARTEKNVCGKRISGSEGEKNKKLLHKIYCPWIARRYFTKQIVSQYLTYTAMKGL